MIILIFGSILLNCGGSGGSSPAPATLPVLKNLGVDIEPYDPATQMAGAFNFPAAAAIDAKIFTAFGDPLDGTTQNPTFEYKTDESAEVVSMTAGTVSSVGFDSENNDYSISVIPTGAASWLINYDHVLNPLVSEGNMVEAGDTLGNVGTWYGGIGRTEIQVINQTNGLSYCPFLVFDEELTSTYENKILNLMDEWEEFESDPYIYNQDIMVYPGCYDETIEG